MEDSNSEEEDLDRGRTFNRDHDTRTELVDFLPASRIPAEDDQESGDNLPSIEEGVEDERLSDLDSSQKSQILLKSAERGRDNLVVKLLEKDSSLINCRDDDGYSPLHRAAYNGHLEVVKILLLRGADVAAKTLDGWQPLHCASRWGQTAVASLLLQNGADINAQTNGKQTPLHFAASAIGGTSTLQLLLCNRYLDPNLINMQNETAYDIAKRSGHHHVLFEMVEDCINVQ